MKERQARASRPGVTASRITALVALTAGLALTALASWQTAAAVQTDARTRFQELAERLSGEIPRRILQAAPALQGARAMFMAVPEMDRATFRTYVAARRLDELSGLLGLGFIERVRREHLNAFVRRERADGAPGFQVRTSGDHADLLVVKYIEPLRRNSHAWGFDLASAPVHRDAADRAITTGQPSLSGSFSLRGAKRDPAWLLFVPVYQAPAHTAAARRAELRGLMYAPIAAAEVLSPLQTLFGNTIDFALYDVAGMEPELVFDSRLSAGPAEPRTDAGRWTELQESRELEIGGRPFTVRITATPALGSPIARNAWLLTALAGAALSLLMATAILRLARGRERAEAQTREGERLIGFIMENIPVRIAYWDAGMRCRMANKALLLALDRPAEEMIGKRVDDILPREQWVRLKPVAAATLRGEPQQLEWASTDSAGNPSTALLHCVPDVHEGRVEGVFMSSVDITELKDARENAQRASQAKTQFLSSMSHEIRTPLNAVLGMLALLRMTPLQERQADYAAKAESAARSLLSLLNDILDVSKIEAGKMALDPRPFSLPTLMEDLEVILFATLGEKPIALHFELDRTLPLWVVGDDMRLRQVLINLGGNAVKFTERGEVCVKVARVGLKGAQVEVEFSVIDTGIGIAPEEQKQIFEDFSQASTSTTRKFGGTGLGLAICARLVGLMGGELQVESTRGRGSRFFFRLWLPVSNVQADPHSRPAPLQEQPIIAEQPLQGCQLLLAEDNAFNQQIARELLTAAGATVRVVSNGREAVRAVAEGGAFDAVLMDVQMPVMDGNEATRRIRQLRDKPRLPIIAMTANAMEGDREESAAAGMDDHVGKPFVPADLVRTILRHTKQTTPPSTMPPQAPDRRLASEAPAPPAQPPLPDAPIDRQRAIEALGGLAELYDGVVPVFRDDLRKKLHLLQAGVELLPRREAIRLAHSLKASAATVGAYKLSVLAARVEEDGEDPQTPIDNSSIGPLAEEMRRVLAALDIQQQQQDS